jgi:hypothetical protein
MGIVADVLEINAAYIVIIIPECNLAPPSGSGTWCPLYFSTQGKQHFGESQDTDSLGSP